MTQGLSLSSFIIPPAEMWDGFLEAADALNPSGCEISEESADAPSPPPESCREESVIESSSGYVPPETREQLLTSQWQWRRCSDLVRRIHDPNCSGYEALSPDPAGLRPEPTPGTPGPLGIYAGHENLNVSSLYPDNGGERSYSEFMHREIQGVLPFICDPHVSLHGVLMRLSGARKRAAIYAGDVRSDMGQSRTKRSVTPIAGAYLEIARADIEELVAQARSFGSDIPLFGKGSWSGKEGSLEITPSPKPGCTCYHFKPETWIPAIRVDSSGHNPRVQFERIKLTEIKVYADDSGRILEYGVVVDEWHQWQPDESIWRHHSLKELCMADRLWGQPLRDLYLEGLYRRAKDPRTNPDDTIKAVAQLHWWLAHAMPFNRGSAGITDALTKAIFYAKGLFPGRWRHGLSPDIKAFHLTRAQFVEQYRAFFI